MKKISLILILIFFISTDSLYGMKGRNHQPKGLTVNVKFDRAEVSDTLELMIVDPFFGGHKVSPENYMDAVKSKSGYFHFRLNPKRNGYFQILLVNNRANMFRGTANSQPLIPISYFENGDSITINVIPLKRKGIDTLLFHFYKWYKYSFSGRGSERLKVMEQVDSVRKLVGDVYASVVFDSNMVFHDPYKQSTIAAYNFLKKYKDKLSDTAYWVLQADIVFSGSPGRFFHIQRYITTRLGMPVTGYLYKMPDSCNLSPEFKRNYNSSLKKAFERYEIPDFALVQSREYLQFLYLKNKIDCLVNSGTKDPDSVFHRICTNYTGKMRDRLLTYFLVNNVYLSKHLNIEIANAMKIVKTSYCIAALKEIRSRGKGSSAYNFKLTNQYGDTVCLNDFKNKVIFLDFWYAGCGACAEFYCSVLSKAEEEFRNSKQIKFISICIDSRSKWLKYLKKDLYTSKLAVNLCTNANDYNSELIKHYGLIAYPSFAVIKSGKVICFNTPEIQGSATYLIKYIRTQL